MHLIDVALIALAGLYAFGKFLWVHAPLPGPPILYAELPEHLRRAPLTLHDWMQCVVTLVVLGASLFIILSRGYASDAEKWAFGMAGLVVGYWIPQKPSRQRKMRSLQKALQRNQNQGGDPS